MRTISPCQLLQPQSQQAVPSGAHDSAKDRQNFLLSMFDGKNIALHKHTCAYWGYYAQSEYQIIKT